MHNAIKPISANNIQSIHFGIDYIRLIYPKFFHSEDLERFFTGMSMNSNYREIDWYDFHFTLNYIFSGSRKSLIFNYKSDAFLMISYYQNENSAVGSRISYMIDIYGTAFYIPELTPFFSKFWQNIGFQGKITRLDLALDLACTTGDILNKEVITQFPKGAKLGYDEKTKDCETRYFGNKHSKNKRHLIRVYDKLKDTEEKNKTKFFKDYFQYDNVSRIETEIRSITCKELKITPQKIGDSEFLEKIFRTLAINESGTYFSALKNIDLAEVQKIKLNRSEIKLPLSRLKKSRRFLNMAIDLHHEATDPIIFLLEHFLHKGVYQNPIEWKNLLDTINNMINGENYTEYIKLKNNK